MSADSLVIDFTRRILKQDSQVLPLSFARKLGQAEDSTQTYHRIAGCWRANYHATCDTVHQHSGGYCGQSVARCLADVTVHLIDVVQCWRADIAPMPPLANCASSTNTVVNNLSDCLAARISAMPHKSACEYSPSVDAPPIANCASVTLSASPQRSHCTYSPTTDSAPQRNCRRAFSSNAPLLPHCQVQQQKPARLVPCEYYPVKLPPPVKPPDWRPCGARPPSNRLPFRFLRRKTRRDSAQIPLPFSCHVDLSIASLPSYPMHHTLTADVDGAPIDPLEISINCDMSGYCWRGQVTLTPSDFAKVAIETRAKGQEAVISFTLDNQLFSILAEDYSDNRAFAKRSYTVSGRNITARLGADYAKTKSGIITGDLYARQLASEQISMTDYKISEWRIPDWLIPANSYALTNQTPIAVIADVAQSAGGFVASHPTEAKLMLRPRWKVPAWDVANTSADVTIPASVILSISGQRHISTQCNGVYAVCTHALGKAAHITRNPTDGTPEASTLSHALYTDDAVLRAAGIAALSDTGNHKTETLTLPLSPKYSIPLAELGQIWQINEPQGYWKGIVAGVGLSIKTNDGAIQVRQSVTLDRYMGDQA